MGLRNRLEKLQEKRHPFCTAVIPAAGSSHRMGGGDKLFMPLAGAPVLLHTVLAVAQANWVDEIVIATREELLLEVADLCAACKLKKPVRVVQGGDSRAASVLNAILAADPKAELVAIHDGARPLVRPEMVDAVIRKGAKTFAAAPAVPVIDTVKVADTEGVVVSTPQRSTLFAVQTPQVFQVDVIKGALQAALESCAEVTDDCAAVERLGKVVYLTDGDRENIKITTPLDLDIAEAVLKRRGEKP